MPVRFDLGLEFNTYFGNPVEYTDYQTRQRKKDIVLSLEQRLGFLQQRTIGHVPSDITWDLANHEQQQRTLARAADLISHQLEVPQMWLYGKDPVRWWNMTDPLHGGPMRLSTWRRINTGREEQAIMGVLQNLAEDTPKGKQIMVGPLRAQGPLQNAPMKVTTPAVKGVDPRTIARYVETLAPLKDDNISLTDGLGVALEAIHQGIPPKVLAQNLIAVQQWVDLHSGTGEQFPFGQALDWNTRVAIAMDAARNTTLHTPADVVRYLSPEVAAKGEKAARLTAISQAYQREAAAGNIPGQGYIRSQIPQPSEQEMQAFSLLNPQAAGFAFTTGQQQLSGDLLERSKQLEDQIRYDQTAFQRSWLGKYVVGPTGRLLDQATKEMFKEIQFVGTLPVALVAGGIEGEKGWHDAWAAHARIVAKIQQGEFQGEQIAEAFHLPRLIGQGLDFYTDWYLDPSILGGRLLADARAAKVFPSLLDKHGFTYFLKSRLPGYEARRATAEFEQLQRATAELKEFVGREAAPLTKAALADKTGAEFGRQLDKYITYAEEQKGLSRPFMQRLRKEILKTKPTFDEAVTQMQAGLLQHFGIKAAEDSPAWRAYAKTQGIADASTQKALEAPLEFGFQPAPRAGLSTEELTRRLASTRSTLKEFSPETLKAARADVAKYGGGVFADTDKSIALYTKLGRPGGNWQEWEYPRRLIGHEQAELKGIALNAGRLEARSPAEITDRFVASAGESLGTMPLTLEVPTKLKPIPGLGGYQLFKLDLASKIAAVQRESEGEKVFGSKFQDAMMHLTGINPGPMMNLSYGTDTFLGRYANRFGRGIFSEDEVRAFQAKAALALTSVAPEATLEGLQQSILKEAVSRALLKENIGKEVKAINPDAFAKLVDDTIGRINEVPYKLQDRLFSVAQAGMRREERRPVWESQLQNFRYVTDPLDIRRYISREYGSIAEARKAMEAQVGRDLNAAEKRAFYTYDNLRGYASDANRIWKFLVVPRPGYIFKVILGDENLRFLATVGSLFERMSGQTLDWFKVPGTKLSLRDWIDKRGLLDDVYRLGDDEVRVVRPGAHENEALARTTFKEADIANEMLRDIDNWERDLKALDSYRVIEGADAAQPRAWAQALNRHIGNSKPGQMALEMIAEGRGPKEIADELAKWARGPGRAMYKARLGREYSMIDEWSKEAADQAYALTMGKKEYAQMVLDGAKTDDMAEIFKGVSIADRPAVYGPGIGKITGERAKWERLMDSWYGLWVRKPEDTLNRMPYYKVWKARAERSYLATLQARGAEELTPQLRQAIDTASRNFALAQVKNIMFDFREQSRIGEMVGAVFPFMQPFQEAFHVWGHIAMRRNPALAGMMRVLWEKGHESGFIHKDKLTGQDVIPAGFYQRALSWTHLAKLPGSGWELSQPLSSLNLFVNSTIPTGGIPIPVPGLSPWAGYALQQVFKNTSIYPLQQYLFQYGPGTRLLPAWLEYFVRSHYPEQFSDDKFVSIEQNFLRLYQYDGQMEGKTPTQLKQMAHDDAEQFLAFRGMLQAFSPGTVFIRFPYADKEDELYTLRENLGFQEGTDAFMEKYPELSLLTISKTMWDLPINPEAPPESQVSGPRIPPSEFATRLLHDPAFQKVIKNEPAWAGLLLTAADPAISEKFNFAAYAQQAASGLIAYKDLDQFLQEGENEPFWRQVTVYKQNYEAIVERLRAEGYSSNDEVIQAEERKYHEFLGVIAQHYPLDAAKYMEQVDPNHPELGYRLGFAGGNAPLQVAYDQARAIVNIPELQKFPGVQGLRMYLTGRDTIANEMSRLGISSLNTQSAEDAGLSQQYDDLLARIHEQYPSAEPFINSFFRNDLLGVTSDAELKIAALQKENPEKYQRYSTIQSKISQMYEKAAASVGGAEQNAAYEAVREYTDSMWANPKTRWAIQLWWDSRGYSYQQQYKFRLPVSGIGPKGWSALDWHIMGHDLDKRAIEAFHQINQLWVTRAQIKEANPTADTSNLFVAMDAIARANMDDKSFAQAVNAMNTWGYGLQKYRKEPGRAGEAWNAVLDTLAVYQRIADAQDLHGTDAGSYPARTQYAALRNIWKAQVQEWEDSSAAFKAQWTALQDEVSHGTLLDFLMPDIYYRLGAGSTSSSSSGGVLPLPPPIS